MAVLGTYIFGSANAGETGAGYPATSVASGLAMTDWADLPAATTIALVTGLGYAAEPVLQYKTGTTSTSLAAAITNNQYNGFTVTPDSGKKMSFTTLTFNIARGGTSTRGYGIYSSVDSYASSLGNANVTTNRPTWTAVSIDLSAAGFQNVTSAITFRFYLYSSSNTSTLELDDIILNGTVADVSGGGFFSRAYYDMSGIHLV